MQKLITIFASALLLGYLVTEMSARFYADNYFALLVMSIAALIINGFFVLRVAGSVAAEPSPNRSQQRSNQQNKNRQQPNRNNNKSKDRGEPRKERPSKPRQTQAPKGDAEEGEVKWFNRSKGYGFIIRPNEEEIFVHQRSIVSDDRRARPILRDGQSVSYIVTKNERGEQAEHVKPLD